jgi:lysophospholipase L1-like esterase
MERTLARVRTSYREMIIRAHEAEIEPILATEVTIRAPKRIVDTAKATVGWLLGASSYQDRINSHVAAMNQWLRETAQRDGLLVLDLQRELGDGDGPRRWAYSVEDGSHISEEGYRVLTDYAVPILRRKLGLPGRP